MVFFLIENAIILRFNLIEKQFGSILIVIFIVSTQITMDDVRRADLLAGNKALIDLPVKADKRKNDILDPRLMLYGYTTETINMLLIPMIQNHKEALGSMGNDAPLACLSQYQPLPYDYFKQLFAQVTNPPIDPFREKIVMSQQCPVGPELNILKASADQVHRIWLESPILSVSDMEVLKRNTYRGWKTKVIDITFPYENAVDGYVEALDRICAEGHDAAQSGYQLLVLSDRVAGPARCPVSALMALGALHQHLIETRQRMKVGLLLETGEAREVHHICVLLGYGADAICPYLVFEMAAILRSDGVLPANLSDSLIYAAYAQAIDTGIAKVMAKMGISTLQSYKGAQIFEAVGVGEDVVARCFQGTHSRIGGVTMATIAMEILERHTMTYNLPNPDLRILRNPGQYHWRSGGEGHINDPSSVGALQEAAISNDMSAYEKYKQSSMQSVRQCTLRGQFELTDDQEKVDISEVESAAEIVKRFATGAMSFGSISLEAHTTLAISMNRIGGKSNTGEGGEDADRYLSKCNIVCDQFDDIIRHISLIFSYRYRSRS